MSSIKINSSSAPSTLDVPRIPIGQVYVTNPRPWWIPVGLESTHDKPSGYRPVFFGGDREFIDDEDGWSVVRNGRRRHRRAHKPRKMMIIDDDASTVA